MRGPLWKARLPTMLFPQPPLGGAPEHCVQLCSPGDGEPGEGGWQPMQGFLSNGGGGQRVGIGTVSAWAGFQMAWGAAPGAPCTNGEWGSGALDTSGCLRGLSFLP